MTQHPPTVVVLHGGTPPPVMDRIEQIASVRYATEPELPAALPGADEILSSRISCCYFSKQWYFNNIFVFFFILVLY